MGSHVSKNREMREPRSLTVAAVSDSMGVWLKSDPVVA